MHVGVSMGECAKGGVHARVCIHMSMHRGVHGSAHVCEHAQACPWVLRVVHTHVCACRCVCMQRVVVCRAMHTTAHMVHECECAQARACAQMCIWQVCTLVSVQR